MKIIRAIFLVQAVLTAAAPWVIAQTVDRSTGTILDSNTSRTVIPPENPAPTKLVATIAPIEKGIPTSGEMIFVMTGNAVSVVGRIVGLEPNKRYQAVVQIPANSATATASIPGPVVNPSSEARPPAAESPPTGSPAPATPTSGPENRSANSTTVITIPPTEADLGMMVSDANGAANLNSTIQNKNLTPPPTGVMGCTVIIKRAPPLDTPEERGPVASGVIVAPATVNPVPPAGR